MTEEAHRLTNAIKQMEASLDDNKPNPNYEMDDNGIKVTYPLTRCLQALKEKYNAVSKLHHERFEQVRSGYCLFRFIESRLTSRRTRRGSRVLRLPPRKLLRPGQAPSHRAECHRFPVIRHFTLLRRVS